MSLPEHIRDLPPDGPVAAMIAGEALNFAVARGICEGLLNNRETHEITRAFCFYTGQRSTSTFHALVKAAMEWGYNPPEQEQLP